MDIGRAKFGRLFAIFLLTFVGLPNPARAGDSDLSAHAQLVGKPLHLIIAFGEQYVDGDELYDVKITVMKVLRGAPAETLVKSASASNPSPRKGFEYVAARVRLEFSARVVPEHYDFTLDPSQFSCVSPEGSTYPAVNLVAQPKPSLHATLHSGESAAGWVVLLVPRNDRTPLMLFVPNVGTTSHTGASSIFRLYSAASLGSAVKSS
jgi:hypothetical protein